jgi:hypothetical protein
VAVFTGGQTRIRVQEALTTNGVGAELTDGYITAISTYILDVQGGTDILLLEQQNVNNRPLELTGRKTSGWGEVLFQNLLDMTQNFSGPVPGPANPFLGQLWYDTGLQLLNIFDGTSWVLLNATSTGVTYRHTQVTPATVWAIAHNLTAPTPFVVEVSYFINQTFTAGTFEIGVPYTIVSVGTTDFTLIGASSNTIGISFVATGVGVGTGTASGLKPILPADQSYPDTNTVRATFTGAETGVAVVRSTVGTLTGTDLSGFSWKTAVRAATTGPVSIATDLENGDLLDSVSLATGDRVLVKDQGTLAENGIYIVQISGAAVRASDMNDASEFSAATVLVKAGSVNQDTAWTQVNEVLTVGVSPVQFNSFGGTYTGGTGLALLGNTFNVNMGAGITELGALPDNVSIDLRNPTTGALILTLDGTTTSTAAGAQLHLLLDPAGNLSQSSLGLRQNKSFHLHTQAVANSTWTVTHNIGQQYPTVTVYDTTDQVIVPLTITADNANQLTVTFTAATAGKVAVSGIA